jgi:hypothetical protein
LAAFINGVPQMLPEVASRLREVCDKTGTSFYDMPKEIVAAGHTAGRDFFIDYCHLSELGIAKVAAGIASRLLGCEEGHGRRPRWATSAGAASAEERFLGAVVGMIHNYHYGQDREIVRHWAVVALKSQWVDALKFLQTLRGVVVTRVREHLTDATLQAMGLTHAAWDPRFNLYITRFVLHARFDVALARVIEEAANALGHTLPALSYDDPLLELDGSLYSLFYLDTLGGTSQISRSSTRFGWGRFELGIVLQGAATVQFPATRRAMAGLEIVLELPSALLVAVEVDGTLLEPIRGTVGLATYTVQLPLRKGAMHRLTLTPERMQGLDAFSDPTDRYFWSLRYGFYPNWGRLHDLRLIPFGEATEHY